MQQIYGQWVESSIPTITLGPGIKLTICNLNRLNTAASGEKHNQRGRGLEEINSRTLHFLSLLSCVSCCLFLHLFLTFASRLNTLFSNPLAHTPFHFSLHLWLCFSSVALSPSLSPTHWHLILQRFPLSKEWNHLPGNGLQPSTMADWRLVILLSLNSTISFSYHSRLISDWFTASHSSQSRALWLPLFSVMKKVTVFKQNLSHQVDSWFSQLVSFMFHTFHLCSFMYFIYVSLWFISKTAKFWLQHQLLGCFFFSNIKIVL